MVRLPVEYQEVEYIESTKGQLLITDVAPVFYEIDEFYMRFAYTDISYTQIFFGGEVSGVQAQGVLIQGSLRPSDICSRYSGSAPFSDNEWIEYLIKDGSLACKDVTGLVRNFAGNSNRKLCLFGKGGEASTRSKMKLSSAYYKRNGEYLVNLIPCYRKSDGEIGMYDTVTKTFFTNQGTGTFLKGNDVNYDNVNLMESRRRILLNTPHLETASGSLVSFKTDVPANLKECKIHFTPVQEGEGTPSPDNVRPITGWDGVTVTIPKGKNLLIPDDPNDPGANYYHTSTGSVQYSVEENGFYNIGAGVAYTTHARRTPTSFFVAPADMTITFSVEYKNVGTTYGIRYYLNNSRITDIHGSADNVWHKYSRTFTVQKGDYFTAIIYSNIYWRNMQIEIGSAASDYEEYIDPTSLTIPFPQTIYGGYVDLVKGEVVEEYGFITADGDENFIYAANAFYENNLLTDRINSSKNELTWYCNKYQIEDSVLNSSYIQYRNDLSVFSQNSESYKKRFWVKDTNYSNVEDFKNSLVSNPINLVYKLATPITYSLTPQTIKALRGLNNLWSNANGNLEIKFWKH